MSQASIYFDILEAVKAVVDALTLTDWNNNAVPSVVLKMASYRTGVDTVKPPAIYISPNHRGEQVQLLTFGDYVSVRYLVDVFTIAGGNSDLSAHIDFYLSWRQQLRRAFQGATLAGVSAVWDTNMKPGDDLNPEAVSKNWDVMLLTVEFRTSEQRLTT